MPHGLKKHDEHRSSNPHKDNGADVCLLLRVAGCSHDGADEGTQVNEARARRPSETRGSSSIQSSSTAWMMGCGRSNRASNAKCSSER